MLIYIYAAGKMDKRKKQSNHIIIIIIFSPGVTECVPMAAIPSTKHIRYGTMHIPSTTHYTLLYYGCYDPDGLLQKIIPCYI